MYGSLSILKELSTTVKLDLFLEQFLSGLNPEDTVFPPHVVLFIGTKG